MVTDCWPEFGPVAGTTALITGCGLITYAAASEPEPYRAEFSVSATVPLAKATGDATSTCVSLIQVTDAAACVPNRTEVRSFAPKRAPTSVTVCPPVNGPVAGDTDDNDGAISTSAFAATLCTQFNNTNLAYSGMLQRTQHRLTAT